MTHENQMTPGAHRDPVEVALGHRGPAQTRRHSATEHVGKPATPALVEQDQQDQEQARDDEQRVEDDHG